MNKTNVDAITLSTVWHTFQSTCREMRHVLDRTAQNYLMAQLHDVAAGIWDGGQLDDRELENLAAYCRRLRREDAPVAALLDFPRRDRCELAREAGAASVLGKPYLNEELLDSIGAKSRRTGEAHVA